MNPEELIKACVRLTPRQQEVLLHVLSGQEDEHIKTHLLNYQTSVSEQLQQLGNAFLGLEHQSAAAGLRSQIVALIARYRPELLGDSPWLTPPLEAAKKVLLSCSSIPELGLELLASLYSGLRERNYTCVLLDDSLRLASQGLQQIEGEIEQAHPLVVLLSRSAASNPLVIEEIRLAKQLSRAKIVAIGVNCSWSLLSYDLRGYLQECTWQEWYSCKDTDAVVSRSLEVVTANQIAFSAALNSRHVSDLAPPQYPPQTFREPCLQPEKVELGTNFYLERLGVEEYCRNEIQQPGALIRIKAPSKMGKTSLMARILHQGQQLGYANVFVSLQFAQLQEQQDLQQFLQWFCTQVAQQLELPTKPVNSWSQLLSSKVACKSYFEKYVLPQCHSALILGVDEVDLMGQNSQLAGDFFSLLRSWHEAAKNRPIWQKLRLVLVHATDLDLPLSINQSPFNVGFPIELPEFTPLQIQDLAAHHGLDLSASQVEQLTAMVGGHPYLVRLACSQLAQSRLSLEQVLATAATNTGIYGEYLRRQWWELQRQPQLVAAVGKISSQAVPVSIESKLASQLYSMGLITWQGDLVTFRCRLYQDFFAQVDSD